MEIILKLNIEDINTNKVGNNFMIKTKENVTIIFSPEALNELLNDYTSLSEEGK